MLCCRVEHQRMHEKHRGHESMHAEMVLILIATLVVAQILLVQWRKYHFRSYQVLYFDVFATMLFRNYLFYHRVTTWRNLNFGN